LSGRRRLLGLAAGLLILIFLALAAASGWNHVTDHGWRFQPAQAIAGFAALVAMYVMSAFGYVLILEQLHGARVDRRRLVAIWARSILARYVPGNVLMVASRLVLGREAGIARRVSLAASVYEQALSLGAVAVGGVILVAAYGARTVGPASWLVAVVPLGLLALHPRLFGPLTERLLRRVGREPLEVLLTSRQLVVLFAWYTVIALLLALGVGLVVHSAVPDAGSLVYIGLSFLASFVISMLAFVFPSGLGVREGVFALALSRDLPGGVAIAASAGIRLVLALAELLFVGAAVLVVRLGRRSGASGDQKPEVAGIPTDEE
jgi:glycosyltransferase 2 family protein